MFCLYIFSITYPAKTTGVPLNGCSTNNSKGKEKIQFQKEEQWQSHAMALVMALFALALRDLLGRYLIGMHAKTNLVHQEDFAIQLLHSQIIISWLVLN